MGVSPEVLAGYLSRTWLVDAALAPVGPHGGLEQPYAFLLLLPLVALLEFFSRERRARIDAALKLSHAYQGTAFLLGACRGRRLPYTG